MNLLSNGEFLTTLAAIHAVTIIYCCLFGTLFHLDLKALRSSQAATQKDNYFPAWIDVGVMFSSGHKGQLQLEA